MGIICANFEKESTIDRKLFELIEKISMCTLSIGFLVAGLGEILILYGLRSYLWALHTVHVLMAVVIRLCIFGKKYARFSWLSTYVMPRCALSCSFVMSRFCLSSLLMSSTWKWVITKYPELLK